MVRSAPVPSSSVNCSSFLLFGTATHSCDLHGAEVGLAERVEVHLVGEQRLDDHLGEADRLLGGCSTGAAGRRAVWRRQGPSSRICGNSSTSRMVGESVSSMVRRSMPMPTPPAGGMPYSSARNIVGVVAHGLVVAHVLGLDLRTEALGLVDRVVELVEGVGVLVAADEQLEALGEPRVAGSFLASGEISSGCSVTNTGWMSLLGHGLEDLGDELALAPRVPGVRRSFSRMATRSSRLRSKGNLFAGIARRHRTWSPARPLAGQVDIDALIADLERAASGFGSRFDEPSVRSIMPLRSEKAWYASMVVNSGLWYGSMPLVAELAADLEHLLETAYEQALERQLGGDAQKVVAIERVEVRHERLCVRAAQDGMQKRVSTS